MPRFLDNITLTEQTAPGTPASGTTVLYVKSDGKVYSKDDAGTEVDLTASGGGGTDPTLYSIAQTSHGFSVGNVVRLSGSNTYAKALANSAANAEVAGIVQTVTDANNFVLRTGGKVTGLSGLTANTTYFLSDITAGLLTSTAPTSTTSVSKPVLIADTTTTGFFFNFRGIIVGSDAPLPTTITSLATDFANHDLAPDEGVILEGHQAVNADGTAVITVDGVGTTEGNANCPIRLYYGQPTTPGTALYDAGGSPISGATMVNLGQVWFDNSARFGRSNIKIESLDPSKELTWQVMAWVVGASASTSVMPGSSTPLGLAISPDGLKLVSCGYGTNDVSIVRLGGRPYSYLIDSEYTDQVETDIATGTNPIDVDIAPLSGGVYKAVVCNYLSSNVSVINLSTNALQGTYAVPSSGNPLRVVCAPNGTDAWIGTAQGVVHKFTIATGSFGTGLNVGGASSQCNGIAITPDGAKVYSAHANGNVYRLSNASPPVVQATIAVGGVPKRLRCVAQGKVWVVSDTTDTIKSVSTTTDAVVDNWGLLYTTGAGKNVLDFAIIKPGTGSTGEITAFIAYKAGWWNQMQIGGLFAGTSHPIHRGQLSDAVGGTYTGDVNAVVVDDYGQIFWAESSLNRILKMPGARFLCRATNTTTAGEFLDVTVES